MPTARSVPSGDTPRPETVVIRPLVHEMARVFASIVARSWSWRSQVTNDDQLRPLSSRQVPSAALRTICDTRGGTGWPGVRGGEKTLPEFGGGFCPPYGPFAALTEARGTMVVRFPDSKIAR
jgi:hypothetical protein